jgi:hypothetical protein
MPAAPTDTLELRVRAAADLFQAPAADPWSELPAEALGRSALEHELGPWLLRRRCAPARIVVRFVAPAADAAETARRAALAPAFARHLEQRAVLTAQRHALLRRRRSHSTWLGLGVLVVTNTIAQALAADLVPLPLPPVLIDILVETFTIIGWVALWVPFESWLVEPIEFRREERFLRLCARIPIEVAPPAVGPL